MKKSILVLTALMLLNVAQGQFQILSDTIQESLIDWEIDPDYTLPTEHLVYIEDNPNRILIKLEVELREEYEAYCYADSTLVETHPTVFNDDGHVLAVYVTKMEWIHKQPTFEGYTKWLREKLGK